MDYPECVTSVEKILQLTNSLVFASYYLALGTSISIYPQMLVNLK